MITIIDYGMGNLMSVAKAFEFIGQRVSVTNDPAQVAAAERLVLPGVGAFGDAMAELSRSGMDDALRTFVATGRPFLGICLGEQLLLDASEEAPGVAGLGLISGKNILFTGEPFRGADRLKVPHMGWNAVRFVASDCPVTRGIPDGSFFYFVHSYYAVPADPAAAAGIAEYGMPFAACLWKDNIFATQFHPEKSQDVGLQMLRRFCTV